MQFIILRCVCFIVGINNYWVAAKHKTWTLRIIHTNDIHGVIDPVTSTGDPCSDSTFKGCYGGVSRHVTLAKQLHWEKPTSTLFLNAGDYNLGTMWSYLLKYKFLAKAVNIINHDALTLGNADFNDGSPGVREYLENLDTNTTAVLGCNVDFSADSLLSPYSLKRSKIFTLDDHKVGVIGYTTPSTQFMNMPSNQTKFTDELDCLSKEAKNLKQQGVDIIIALGHSGYEKDIEIAKTIPDITVVVGGHSHTLLGHDSLGIKAAGPYPTTIQRDDGSTCLVVQAYARGFFFGKLDITFDRKKCKLKSWNGSPILVDDSIATDPEMDKMLLKYRDTVKQEVERVVGKTEVLLDAETCSYAECNLGNLLTDAIVNHMLIRPNGSTTTEWAYVNAAVLNSHSILGSISETDNDGKIRVADLLKIMPPFNQIWFFNITGSGIYSLFEYFAANYSSQIIDPSPDFLQVSGFQIMLDLNKPPNRRVVAIKVRCRHCRVPAFENLQLDSVYQVASLSDLVKNLVRAEQILEQNIVKTTVVQLNVTEKYMEQFSPLWQDIGDRIVILSKSQSVACDNNNKLEISTESKGKAAGQPSYVVAHLVIVATIVPILGSWRY